MTAAPCAVSEASWRRFAPRVGSDGAAYARIAALAVLPEAEARARLREAAEAWGDKTELGLAARAAALLVADMVALGWAVRRVGHWLEVAPPLTSKAATRKQLLFGRDDQLAEPPTRNFIRQLERPHRTSRCQPIQVLVEDGRRLAARLAPIAAAPRVERAAMLERVCRPYLQLVSSDERDIHSGIRLMDIWRYFRHTWATRYRSTPGRNLFYLVRDAASERHPVMGIVALGNTVMQLSCRDDELGWSLDGLVAQVAAGDVSDGEIISALRARVEEDLLQIFVEDLPIGGPLPRLVGDEVLDRLKLLERDAMAKRVGDLGSEDAARHAKVDDVTKVDLRAQALTPLFTAKRARAVRELLRAYRALSMWSGTVADARSDSEAGWALEQGLRQLKKHFSATAMMEITVCGAVAPYNELLGGKLACLMMLSPQVRDDYARRYGDEFSIIASQMAGRPISKAPVLTYLGTTSLYGEKSSQYNRVVLPLGTLPGQAAAVAFRELGTSRGYGSPNLSRDTELALDALLRQKRGYTNVNYVFGEGQSPKMRSLRESLAVLGLDDADVLQHGSSRLVYGVELATNTRRFLLGVDPRPAYTIPDGATSEDIASFWRERWLASRLDHAPALERVAASRPIDLLVWTTLPPRQPAAQQPQTDLFKPNPHEVKPMAMSASDDKLTYIRQLYRDESAYSDHVPVSLLKELHVRTDLEKTIEDAIKAGASVVITGNAGDGKTHVIRLLEQTLKRAGAEVIRDASEHSPEHVMTVWAEARAARRPVCIAINEGPLVALVKANQSEHPWLAALRESLLGLVRYVRIEQETLEKNSFKPQAGETVLIDLSYRRTLSRHLVKPVLAKLVENRWYESCVQCPSASTCAVTYNRAMLSQAPVQERVSTLLEHVSTRGHRATFRELLGFGSFLIFGGQGCEEHAQQAGSEDLRYYNNAFSGLGEIFDTLSRGLDPVQQTHAQVDEQLWSGRLPAGELRGDVRAPAVMRDLDDVGAKEPEESLETFRSLKRRWYFEHEAGRVLHSTEPDRLFERLVDPGRAEQQRVGDLLALLNRWWSPDQRDLQEHLRLWTRLSFAPRARNQTMVSGRDVASLKLTILRPRLTPALEAALGQVEPEHVVLAPPDPGRARFASLRVDRALLATLLAGGTSRRNSIPERQVVQFNDALAQHAEPGGSIRKIEIVDTLTGERAWLRVDLNQRRYDSAERS